MHPRVRAAMRGAGGPGAGHPPGSVSSGREHAVRGRNEGADAPRHDLRSSATERDAERDAEPSVEPTPAPATAPVTANGHARRPNGAEHRLPAAAGPSLTHCPNCSTALPPQVTNPAPDETDRLVAALRASESRFRAAFADAGIGMALIDSDDLVIEANPAFAELLGRDVAELVRLHIHAIIDPEDAPRRLYLDLVAGKRDRVQVEKQLKRRDGQPVWAKITISLIRDGAGRPLYTLAMFEDITERRTLGDRLQYQALHDPLTRLPNRTFFFERLDAACRPASAPAPGLVAAGRRVGVCCLDLDGFAAINDTLGHHIGDQLLIAVAGRLERRFAQEQGLLVARLGGDEFALLVANSEGSDQLTLLAGQLLTALERPFDVAGHRLVVTASVGVVERSVTATSATDLVKDADATLYWSKADGRARWTLYDRDRGAHQMTRQLLSTTLRPALERGEFTVLYQPLVGLADGTVHGAEALVRWRHPRYGTLSPDRFIPLAEESGAIVPLGKWVLEESCRQARRWLAEFPDTQAFVSVNLAARQVWDSDVVADVAEVLERTGLPARLLQLELTESAVLGPGGRPLQALQALADMGVRIAIDDFGTGYSNLAYLSRLPVHALKLDGTFIEGFRDPAPTGRPDLRSRRSEADEQIVGAMVRLAHDLGLTVTAEGIESAAQAERLRLTGCDTAQGWYFARPGEADLVAGILREGRIRIESPAPPAQEKPA